MTDRPILFNCAMVRALLAGTKTQTRRIAKPPDSVLWDMSRATNENGSYLKVPFRNPDEAWEKDPALDTRDRVYCPYGQRGDRLWVRESIRRIGDVGGDDVRSEFIADGELTLADAWPWKNKSLPSIHCPSGLSRITLEITDVRVQRLHEISEDDAVAEGLDRIAVTSETTGTRWAFRALWESINGPYSWDFNPWVWVLTFKRVQA